MKDKKELLREMEKAMDRYDLSKEIEKAYIGEWRYGVAMVPCDWVYKYVAQPEIVRCKDCKWYSSEMSWCNNLNSPKEQTFYCADGKRR